jgi:lysyl-tRNA synthetase class II
MLPLTSIIINSSFSQLSSNQRHLSSSSSHAQKTNDTTTDSTTSTTTAATTSEWPIRNDRIRDPHYRTHYIGSLNGAEHHGTTVKISGWLSSKREISSKLIFLVLRDQYGSIQIKCTDTDGLSADTLTRIKNLPLESIVQVEGSVQWRPQSMVNSAMKSGDIEIVATNLNVLNEAQLLPFDVRSTDLVRRRESKRNKRKVIPLTLPNTGSRGTASSLSFHRPSPLSPSSQHHSPLKRRPNCAQLFRRQ